MKGFRLSAAFASSTSAVALLTGLAMPSVATAQTDSSTAQADTPAAQSRSDTGPNAPDDHDIVVTGVRASLER